MQKNNPIRIFDIRLHDGQWVRVSALFEQSPPALPRYLLLFTLAIVIAVVMLAVRQAGQPLQKLALAADQLGDNLNAPPLAETGPAEGRAQPQPLIVCRPASAVWSMSEPEHWLCSARSAYTADPSGGQDRVHRR